MDLGLSGRVALVTGASRGIGRAIAEGLAAEGARVAVAARTADVVEALGEQLGGRGYAFDSTDLDAIDPLRRRDAVRPRADRRVRRQHRRAAALRGPAGARRDRSGRRAYRELVVSPMLIMRRVVPGMRERGFGRVVAVSSLVAREPLAGLQLSNVNRPGLLAGMKQLAREHAADGVTYNAVLPGRIATDRIASGYGSMDAAQEAARGEVPAGRLGTPQEVARRGAVPVLGASELRDGPVAARRRRPDAALVSSGEVAALVEALEAVVGDRLPRRRRRRRTRGSSAARRGSSSKAAMRTLSWLWSSGLRLKRWPPQAAAEALLEAAVGVAPPRQQLLAGLQLERIAVDARLDRGGRARAPLAARAVAVAGVDRRRAELEAHAAAEAAAGERVGHPAQSCATAPRARAGHAVRDGSRPRQRRARGPRAQRIA